VYFRLIGYYLAQQLKIELSYRTNLLVGFIGQLLFTLMSVVFVGAFLRFGQTINGWGFYDILFLFGLSDLAFGLNAIFIFRTYFSLNAAYIVGGGLDQLLVQPVPPLLNIILHNINVADSVIALKGAAIIFIAAPHLSIVWGPVMFLKLAVLVLAGASIDAGILLFIAATGFWMTRRNDTAMAFLGITQLTQYPLSIYPRSVQVFLSFLLPLAFTAFYPAQYLLGIAPGISGYAFSMAGIVLVACICVLSSWAVFQWGLRRYNSAGS